MEEIVQLRLTTSRAEWLKSLSAFVKEYDASSSSKASTNQSDVITAVEIVSEKLVDEAGDGRSDTETGNTS